MGTRSLTRFMDGETEIACMYGQFDGYPDGIGKDIKEALKDRYLVNGYTDPNTQCNGMGCLAAMVVGKLKDGCGNVYLNPPGTKGIGEDYTYVLCAGEEETFGRKGQRFPMKGRHIMLKIQSGDTVIYDGKLSDFDPEAVQKQGEEVTE